MSPNKDDNPVTTAAGDQLRRNAEERLRTKSAPRTKETAQRLVHELDVHQIELEIQNEELSQVLHELELSRNKYAELYDFAPVGYFTLDRQGRIKEVNLAGAKLLGEGRKSLADASFKNFIADAAGRKIFSDHLETVLQKPGMHRCEIRLAGRDGALIYGLFQSVRVDLFEAEEYRILSSIVDGTQSKQLEKEIQTARKYAENIVETVREPLLVLDSDLKILTANRSFYQTFRVKPEATVGKLIQDIGNRQWDSPELKALFKAILAHGTEFNDYEVEHDFPAIGRRVFQLNARGISRDDIGAPIILLAMEDITKRKQAEEERDRLALIVESSNDGIFSISLDHAITSWNKGAENIFGFCAAEIIGKPVFTIIPVQRRAERSQILEMILRGEELQHYETTRTRKDGREIYVSITTSPMLSAEGMIVGNAVIARDVTERRKMEEIIRHQANHDPLTDLPNRQLFMELLSLELADARRYAKQLALLFLDLNGFKQVNDTLGHSCGDRLLQEVAKRLRDCIRESDTVARLGGDEFTVLMPDLGTAADVGVVIRKILGVFETEFIFDDAAVDCSTSIGVCMFPDDGADGEELMKKADIAMYDAKGSGKNSFQFYNAEINARTLKRQKLEEYLRLALDRDQFELFYLPVVSNETRGIVGAEALLRWHHPEQGLLCPDEFLSVAEDSGTIVPIGEWVIRKACAQVRAWNEKGYPLSVSVNLSNRQFHQPNFIENVARIHAETGLLPYQLEFELTEQSIMANIDFSLRNMTALNEMGITLIIDNFGSGSSSLQCIKKMPSQKVKIDRSFVLNMLDEPDDLAVVNTIITMSHNLRMKVVASGVETEEQASTIKESGCDELQGYIISRPLPAAEFELFLKTFNAPVVNDDSGGNAG
jgi:diguanylate cyclase (GGDEF)-like protein/PAS domain S-box-containing protein